MTVPIPNAYWVDPGRLLAGEYPGERTDEETQLRLRAFVAAGVNSFFDLTESSELFYESFGSYRDKLAPGTRYLRTPIPDLGCPSERQMLAILDQIDRELADGRVVYLHCYGGVGRTGTVVGCWLTRRRISGEQALDVIATLRTGIPDPLSNLSPPISELFAGIPNGRHDLSPSTQQQRDFVRDWPERERTIEAEVRLACGRGA